LNAVNHLMRVHELVPLGYKGGCLEVTCDHGRLYRGGEKSTPPTEVQGVKGHDVVSVRLVERGECWVKVIR